MPNDIEIERTSHPVDGLDRISALSDEFKNELRATYTPEEIARALEPRRENWYKTSPYPPELGR